MEDGDTILIIGGIASGMLFFGSLVYFLFNSRMPEFTSPPGLTFLMKKIQLTGRDMMPSQYTDDVKLCGKKCLITKKCKAYSFNTKTKQCSLKDVIGNKIPENDVISGIFT